MARLGMIIDISHTSEETARDVLRHSQAPVIFSHSNARGVWDVPRNVPDDILESLQRNDTVDAVVMATFAPQFVSQHEKGGGVKATLSEVAGRHEVRWQSLQVYTNIHIRSHRIYRPQGWQTTSWDWLRF